MRWNYPSLRVQKGDLLRVRPEKKFPWTASIVEGRSSVDESMITGESMPEMKIAGDKVTGGTLNQTGSFLMRAERVGKETVLSQIVAMVASAQPEPRPHSAPGRQNLRLLRPCRHCNRRSYLRRLGRVWTRAPLCLRPH